MRIAWFTPFSTRSAIGRCSQAIVGALEHQTEVEVCYFDNEETYRVNVPSRKFAAHSQVDAAVLSRYDAVIYNFGNHLPFHKDIYEISRRWPGICILHDFVVQHFIAGYYLEHLSDPNGYVKLMESLYGADGYRAAMESLSGNRIWESDEVVQYPLFEALIRGAEGVITHSEFFRKRASEMFAGPLRSIPLPYSVDLNTPPLSRKSLGLPEDSLLAITIGHANPNKQILSIVETLGAVRGQTSDFTYVIIGSFSPGYQREVEAAIRRNRLDSHVRVVGEVTNEVLRSYLVHADLCVNLRYPVMEGASASAIEEMLFGKPVIVADVGFYAELPDDCVVKVAPRSQQELGMALGRLLSKLGYEERKRLGEKAAQYASGQFRADRYAKELLNFVDEVRETRPLLGLADKLAGELTRMTVTADMQIVRTLGKELGELFCERRD